MKQMRRSKQSNEINSNSSSGLQGEKTVAGFSLPSAGTVNIEGADMSRTFVILVPYERATPKDDGLTEERHNVDRVERICRGGEYE